MAVVKYAPKRRSSRVKKAVVILGSALLLVLVGLVLFVALFDFSGYIQRKASGSSGREVTLSGKTEIAWSWKPRLTIHGLRIGNMEGAKEPLMASVDSIVVVLDAKQLLRGRIVLSEVTLDNPDLALEQDKDGNANWHFGSNPEGKAVDAITPDSRAEIPAIGRLKITNGRLRYDDAIGKINIDSKLSTIEGTLKDKQAIRIDGNGTFKNQPFKLVFTGGSVLTLQDTNEPYPLKADIAIGGTHAKLDGTVMDPLQLKGLDLQLDLVGKNASDIFPILGIALPPTPPYKLVGHLGLENEVWKFSNFKGKLGNSDLAGNLAWNTHEKKRPLLTADFTSQRLDFADLAGFIGATPEEVKKDDRVIPDMPLDISRMSAMDADVEFTGKRINTDLPLDDFYMKLGLENKLLTLAPLKFGTASGDIVANMTVDARQEPVKIGGEFQFRRLSLERLFGGLEKSLGATPSAGYIGGTAKLKGTGKSLRDMLATSNGTIGLGMEGGQLSNLIVEILGLDVAESLGFLLSGDKPVNVRCVIADFGVTQGLMQSNTILIDTTDTNVSGKGTLNLKNEAMNIRLKAAPKDPSLLSLKTPITVGGTLGNPSVGVAGDQLAARGTAAGVLGVLFPPAAVLAFIEPGLGKDGDCAKLLVEMNQNTGKRDSNNLVPKNK